MSALVPVATGVFAALIWLAILTIGAVIGSTARRRRTGRSPAAGAGQPGRDPGPAPGHKVPGDRAADPPPRPAPAPAGERLPKHGGRVKTTVLWADGRVSAFDHRTGIAKVEPGFCPDCAEGGDWNIALRELTE